MICEEFRDSILDDDPATLRHARVHAATCAACAEIVAGHEKLAGLAAAWRNETLEPPAGLERRIAGALARHAGTGVQPAARFGVRFPLLRIRPAWIAFAAILLIALAGVARLHPWRVASPPPGDDLEDVYEQIAKAERDYAGAIAELDRRASRVLARASDSSLPPADAARLLRFADKLDHLDSVIRDVKKILADNPGHSGGHTILLAAYREKADVLREVVDLRFGGKT